jgi:hypothetical protein
MTHRRLLVNDPALMGLFDARLCFTAFPGSPSEYEIGNVDSPVFSFDPQFRRIRTTASAFRGVFASEEGPFDVGVNIPETQDPDRVCAFWGSANARGAADALTGGLQWGVATRSRVLARDDCPVSATARTRATVEALHNYRVNTTGVGTSAPYPLGYKLQVSGRVTVVGRQDMPSDAFWVGYSIAADHTIERADHGLRRERP